MGTNDGMGCTRGIVRNTHACSLQPRISMLLPPVLHIINSTWRYLSAFIPMCRPIHIGSVDAYVILLLMCSHLLVGSAFPHVWDIQIGKIQNCSLGGSRLPSASALLIEKSIAHKHTQHQILIVCVHVVTHRIAQSPYERAAAAITIEQRNEYFMIRELGVRGAHYRYSTTNKVKWATDASAEFGENHPVRRTGYERVGPSHMWL